ncbi:multicomponent Na+:H+ antiporter subunit E [Alkalispirochaeta americana]|uniref:Multicomponent Na+:H+ antiporter subunit E n=1 Tax=Alkalispirochaeta americana TaxID=159291 RepID=A0A1N6QR77_9SPIO|nr:Na+/H+ antiporter subunit E [Alkalispirochaeta americana]SIQ19119.1 multicomponent Na+:H+ antiporter subunit E [Alkalispirochaeta americana]
MIDPRRNRFIKDTLRGGGDYLGSLAMLLLVWTVWNESLSLYTLLEGTILGIMALCVTNRFLLKERYQGVYRLGPGKAFRYVVVLLGEIVRSGIHAIYVTLTNRINVGIVDVPTDLRDTLAGVLVANAITLTPGTVTVDYDTKRFKVVWIDCPTTDPEEAGEMIKGRFERVFLGRSSGGNAVMEPKREDES